MSIKRDARLNELVNELMQDGGKYNPLDADNFNKAFRKLTDPQIARIANECIKYPDSTAELIRDYIVDFWTRLATTEADAMIEEEEIVAAEAEHADATGAEYRKQYGFKGE